MNTELNGIFSSHAEWLESEGESGNQLTLDNISSEQLTSEQLQFLTDSILTECSFTDIVLNEIDLYHTEMYSCKFSKASFHKVQLIKSEVNDTEFTKQRLGFDFPLCNTPSKNVTVLKKSVTAPRKTVTKPTAKKIVSKVAWFAKIKGAPVRAPLRLSNYR